MAEMDGEIRIGAKIETKEFEKEADKLVSKIEKQTESIKKQELVIDRIVNKIAKLSANAIAKFIKPEFFDSNTNEQLSILKRSWELAKDKSKRLNDELEKTKTKLSELKTKISELKTKEIFQPFTSGFSKLKGFFNGIGNVLGTINNKILQFGKRIFNLASSALIFNVISAGFRQVSRDMMTLINSDSSLSESLNKIKTNLYTAFAPIYQSVLPALRALGNFISKVTLEIANFVSMLTGNTLKQSQQYADNMIKSLESSEKNSNSLGKQSTKLGKFGKQLKSATRELASFDKINVLSQSHTNKNKDSGFKPIFESLDKLNTSKLSLFGDFFDNINFDKLNNSLNNLKETLGRITGKELKWLNWLYYNLLRPLGEWTLNDAVPEFIDLLNASLKAFEPLGDALRESFEVIWDNFLKPISEWNGERIIDSLNLLTKALTGISDWGRENKTAMEWISALIIGLGSGLAFVSLVKFTEKIVKLSKTVLPDFTKKIWETTIALLSNPWTWVVIGIGAVIAAIIMITKHWDKMEQYFGAAADSFRNFGESIMNLFSDIGEHIQGWFDFIAGLFTFDWKRIWNGASNIVVSAMNFLIDGMNSVVSLISGILNSIMGGINFAIKGINSLGANIPTIPLTPDPYRIPRLQVPRLAQGAVLQGGNPMLAYLNDQPRGQVNIETPLKTMIDAFNSALDRRNGNITIEATGDMAQLVSFLNLRLKKENARVGDLMVKGDVWV